MTTQHNDTPSRTLAARFDIAVGRLARRSDVVITGWMTLQRQPFGSVEKRMPPDLVEVYKQLGAVRLQWRFADDSPTARRGELLLRAPSNEGWWSLEYQKSHSDRPQFYRGLNGPANGRLRDPDGTAWPAGTKYQIIEGREEWGVLWRFDSDGRSSYATFEGGNTRPLPTTDMVALLDDFLARSFAGNFGKPDVAWASTVPDPQTRDRLASDAPPRITADVEVLENRPLSWPETRAAHLGDHYPHVLGALGGIFGLPDLEGMPLLERGRLLAEATSAPKIEAAKVDAVMKAVVGVKRPKKEFDAWRLIAEGDAQSLVTLRIAPRTLGDGMELEGVEFFRADEARRALLDLPGFAAPEGLDTDLVRFSKTDGLGRVRLLESVVTGSSVRMTLAAPTPWVSSIATGTYASPMRTQLSPR